MNDIIKDAEVIKNCLGRMKTNIHLLKKHTEDKKDMELIEQIEADIKKAKGYAHEIQVRVENEEL